MHVDDAVIRSVRAHIHVLALIAPDFTRHNKGRCELSLGDSGQLCARVFFGDMLVDEFQPELYG